MSNILLIGDAAGLCGAFAADGIKGSVVSGKEGAAIIPRLLAGDRTAAHSFHERIETHSYLMEYYRRQLRYRWLWDRMKRDRSFRAMYDVIAAERNSFLDQFCDSKDKRRSLARVVLKPRHVLRICRYAGAVLLDMIAPPKKMRLREIEIGT